MCLAVGDAGKLWKVGRLEEMMKSGKKDRMIVRPKDRKSERMNEKMNLRKRISGT